MTLVALTCLLHSFIPKVSTVNSTLSNSYEAGVYLPNVVWGEVFFLGYLLVEMEIVFHNMLKELLHLFSFVYNWL